MFFSVLTTTVMFLSRFESKMRLKSILAFILVGFKCLGLATTDVFLTRTKDYFQSVTPLIHVNGAPHLGDDDVQFFTTTFRACISASASLLENCIESIHHNHQFLDKKSNRLKLHFMKLAMCLEQYISLSKTAFEVECHKEKKEFNVVLYATLYHSAKCFQNVLGDSEIQVQAVGLQVLKGILQRGATAESNSIALFFVGELVEDIITLILEILKRVISREAVAIVGECLKILMLLQTI